MRRRLAVLLVAGAGLSTCAAAGGQTTYTDIFKGHTSQHRRITIAVVETGGLSSPYLVARIPCPKVGGNGYATFGGSGFSTTLTSDRRFSVTERPMFPTGDRYKITLKGRVTGEQVDGRVGTRITGTLQGKFHSYHGFNCSTHTRITYTAKYVRRQS